MLIQNIYTYTKNNQQFQNYLLKTKDCYLTFQTPKA